jgi:hypothetical protein
MYFWNVNALTADLRQGRVGQRDEMLYLAAWTSYHLFELQNALWMWELPTPLTVGKAFAVLAISVAGIVICYRANCRGDGEHFLVRFVCISWPIRVKLTVLFFAAAGLLAIVVSLLGVDKRMIFEPLGDPSGPAFASIWVALHLVYYLWLRRQIVRISRRGEATDNGIAAS